ncbi:MAG: polysaccharide biosynthesis tyrosine autokinase, partial [Pseudomonadota bacterium]|nr:polysaccharide biosynthesis tyrosine autokinase [Pseudomonadota bacterium]
MRREPDNLSHLPIPRPEQGPHDLVAYDPYANTYVPDDEIDLRELWRVITKHKGTIFTVLTLVLATTVIATLLMRPVYRAEALLEIKPDSGRMVKFQSLEQADYQPLEYKTTQQNILQSDSVAEAVIEDLDLAENPEMTGDLAQRGFVSGIKQVVTPLKKMIRGEKAPVSEEDAANREQIEMLSRFHERLTVSPIKRSDLFKVSFDSFDPQLASSAANSVVDEYMRLNQERRFDSTSGAKEFLQKEIAKIQSKLEASEKDLTEFARKHQIVDVEEKDDIMTVRLTDLSAQLTAINGERVAAEALYVQSQSENGIEVLPAVLRDELIQELKGDYTELQGEYFKLSRIYKPAYPKLQQLQAELDRVKSSLDTETQRIVDGLKTNFEQLQKKELLLEERLEQQKTNLLSLKDRSIQYNILKREWETNRQLYTGLLERMKEVGVAAGMEINNISLIDRAKTPVEQYKPNLKLNALLAAVLGLAGGIGLAFLLAYLDNTVRTPEELERLVAVSSLGMVPKQSSGKGSKKRKKKAKALETEAPAGIELVSHYERDNELSEAFRSVRTSLMFSSPAGLPKVLQVTSTGPGEGKTTIAANLAAVLADNGARVLLVDADLRKPRVHKIFKIPSAPGLTEYLTGQFETSPVRRTEIENLAVIPSGTPPPNPAELLGSKAMDEFLEEMSGLYDHVLLDSAPLLGLADSVIISTKVDGVIYTVLAGEINRDGLREGVKRLRRVHAPVLG